MTLKNRSTVKKRDFSFWMIVVSCVCTIAQFYALPHGISFLALLSNRCLLLIWILVFGLIVGKRMATPFPRRMVSAVLLIVLSLLSLTVAAVEQIGALGTNIKELIGFLALIMMLMYSAFFEIKDIKAVVLFANIAASLIFISLYYSNLRYVYTGDYGIAQIDALTLGYSNPNLTAIYLFVCAINLVIAIFYFKQKLLRFLLLLDVAHILMMLYKTESRTAILLIAAFLILSICSFFYKLPKWCLGVAIIMPLAYAVIAQWFLPYFEGVTFKGESIFNGREDIFSRYFNNLDALSFILGDFNEFKFDNLHNGYVSIAATLGVPGLICFILFLKESIYMNYRPKEFERYESVAFWGFICIVMYACTEASLFVGSASYGFLLFSTFLLFAKPYAAERITE